MKEKDIAKKLSPLKDITPSSQRIKRMKENIFREIEGKKIRERDSKGYDRYQFLLRPQYLLLILLLIILGIFSMPSTQKNIQPVIFSARIALASNHYEKAKLAFEEAQGQLGSINDSEASSYQQVMATTTTTNGYISHLQLQGEKGKYTKEQCKNLYQQYALYLSTLNQHLQAEKQFRYEATVLNYQKEAKSRLAFYKT